MQNSFDEEMEFTYGPNGDMLTGKIVISFQQLQLLITLASHMEHDISDYYGKDGAQMKIEYARINAFYQSIMNGRFMPIS